MTERISIAIDELKTRNIGIWENDWFLLTCGDIAKNQFNAMTISWGSIGVMWNKPFVQVVVRPQRFTFEFMEKFPTFTITSFDRTYRKALNLLGTRSGRDENKIQKSGLTPQAASKIPAPTYVEAILSIECRKIYWQDFDPSHFLDNTILSNYPRNDFHRIYYGEILAVTGIPIYKTE